MQLASASAAETEEIAGRLARQLRVGDVVTVSGELGTGKTTFVRGACRALGITTPVTSPTFTVGHRYAGDPDVSDEATLMHRLGLTVVTVPGEAANVHVTTPDELRLISIVAEQFLD